MTSWTFKYKKTACDIVSHADFIDNVKYLESGPNEIRSLSAV